MKYLSCFTLMLATTALAADPASSAPTAPKRSQFVFSLLPKSFQRHPSLDFHVITELTPEGKKVAPPTADRPAYYIAQPGKFTQAGNNTPANEHAPDLTVLTHAMQRALASSHYVPATPGSPLPAIAVVFNYGSFARFSTEAYDFETDQAMAQLNEQARDTAARSGGDAPGDLMTGSFAGSDSDRDADSLLPIVLAHKQERDDVLRRAALIGGDKFAHDLAEAFNQEAKYREAGGGAGLSPSMDGASPFHRFINANEESLMLVDESFSGCYFVVASAYDYVAMKHGQRVLLWRTKMTVNSSGIAMSESLPSLVVAAGPYFGKEMTTAVTLTRKIDREGRVEVGEARVVEDPVPATPPPPPAAAEKLKR